MKNIVFEVKYYFYFSKNQNLNINFFLKKKMVLRTFDKPYIILTIRFIKNNNIRFIPLF